MSDKPDYVGFARELTELSKRYNIVISGREETWLEDLAQAQFTFSHYEADNFGELKAKFKGGKSMSDELKKCPFCGGEWEEALTFIFGESTKKDHYIICKTCRAGGPVMNTPEEAIAAWNRRGEWR